jgi:hypothetical protein
MINNKINEDTVEDHLEKLEVLSEIYRDLSKRRYENKTERDLAKLKMQLIKKEILLISYLINKDIESISAG